MADSKSTAGPSSSSGGEAATKARIIAHMNRDHATELSHYLRAFNGIPASAARDPQLTDLTLDSMTIRTSSSPSSSPHVVRIAPPMGSLADARARTVEMAQRARRQLGLSDVRVTAFARPDSAALAGFVGASVVVMSVCTLGLGLVRPGSWAWRALDDAALWGGAAGFRWLVKVVFAPLVAVHVVEAGWIARSRLARHGVEAGTALWWKWVAAQFLEGVPAMWRFDALVERQRKEMESAKH
ncbi:hypothetical protein SLS62_002086 [Diatrype stigma]|uniref:DUF2470 domain-containing protein n=1 Tax=Diatrype stigma TaxID=117547 RepID=A0AAN9UXP6_9PEZI